MCTPITLSIAWWTDANGETRHAWTQTPNWKLYLDNWQARRAIR